MKIREATKTDEATIRGVCLSAFPESEREQVAELAVALLSDKSAPPTLSLVAEIDDEVVGHVAFSPVTSAGDGRFLGYILSPLGVRPQNQKQGIGTQLITSGIQQLSQTDAEVVLVYGDPAYYGRFGFRTDVANCCLPPYELEYPFGWQGIALGDQNILSSTIPITCVPCLSDPALW